MMTDWCTTFETRVGIKTLSKTIADAPISVQRTVIEAMIEDYHSIGFELANMPAYDDTKLDETLEHYSELHNVSMILAGLETAQQAMRNYIHLYELADEFNSQKGA